MQIITDIAALRSILDSWRKQNLSIALVPTMGNLHNGHIALVTEATNCCDRVVTTIFVNPMQFGANEDLGRYPHTPGQDEAKLNDAGCDLLFRPPVEVMYPEGLDTQTRVSVPGLSLLHCGASRPGHFDGVATIVTKLLNLVPADFAFFGKKDFQQLLIIRKLANDLCFAHTIIGLPTIRESDGLAMSSRNQYLNESDRQHAPRLYQALQEAALRINKGERDYRQLEKEFHDSLNSTPVRVDYFSICEAATLTLASNTDKQLVILGAIYLGTTRLIDNISVTLRSR
jgi:pantoate--beta-alanine ligase